jgi:hypothetical protein
MPRLQTVIEKYNVRSEITMTNERPPADMNMPAGSNAWRVVLKMGRRQLTTPFYTGPMAGEPNASDVLGCLISDTTGYEGVRNFDHWCAEYGYEPDSRRAEHTYKAIEQQAVKLRRFLGDRFEEFARAEW